MSLELLLADATTLAGRLRDGTLGSEALTRMTLAHIARCDARINSFVALDAEGALAQARAADARRAAGATLGPLDGLLLAAKDNIDVRGFATNAGLGLRDTPPARADAPVVAHLRAAGMVMLGKLNMHEVALGATNENPHWGNCHNPHRIGFTPGGSSGGSGAAVAAGFCAFALGTDTMGSVRIPAAYCGVSGYKPSRGRISARGVVVCQRRLDTVGPLARSVRDLALIEPILAAFDSGCAQSREFPPEVESPSVLQPVLAAATGLGDLQSDVQAAYRRSLEQLAAAGITLRPVDLSGYDFGAARRAGLLAVEADLCVEHEARLRQQPQAFSPALQHMMNFARHRSAVDLARAEWVMDAALPQLRAWLDGVDALVLPSAAQSAFAFGAPAPAGQADFTAIANMAGAPALSLPMGYGENGLPLGLQLIAAPGADAALLAIAGRVEACLRVAARTPAALL